MAQTTHAEKQKRKAGAALVISSAIASSSKAIFIKLAYGYRVNQITLLALRGAFAMPFFLVTALWIRKRAETARLSIGDRLALIVLGCVGYYVAATLDFIGLKYISAGWSA
ncbi:MAG: EamA family transporter [Acidiferrobacterales bacterium]